MAAAAVVVEGGEAAVAAGGGQVELAAAEAPPLTSKHGSPAAVTGGEWAMIWLVCAAGRVVSSLCDLV